MQDQVTNTITIHIMDRELKIKCPKDKTSELQEAATYLDNKMREIHQGNKLITIDRVAITAALNITNELILTKQQSQLIIRDLNQRLTNIKNKLSTAGVIS
jgi:cell division protein ZapA